jgi:hypothetical protein
MKNFSDKILNRHFSLKKFAENRAVYEIMWQSMVESEGPQMTI